MAIKEVFTETEEVFTEMEQKFTQDLADILGYSVGTQHIILEWSTEKVFPDPYQKILEDVEKNAEN